MTEVIQKHVKSDSLPNDSRYRSEMNGLAHILPTDLESQHLPPLPAAPPAEPTSTSLKRKASTFMEVSLDSYSKRRKTDEYVGYMGRANAGFAGRYSNLHLRKVLASMIADVQATIEHNMRRFVSDGLAGRMREIIGTEKADAKIQLKSLLTADPNLDTKKEAAETRIAAIDDLTKQAEELMRCKE